MRNTVINSIPSDKLMHHLHSPRKKGRGVLVISSYDYCLHRGDLKILFKTYDEIVLIPNTTTDEDQITFKINSLLEDCQDIHLIVNPKYESRFKRIYELIAICNKSIKISTIYDFCENELFKIYIPKSIEDENPTLMNNEFGFSKRVRYPKKIMDMMISIILFVISLPIWIFSFIRIKIQSPGPVFYSQERTGLNNRSFYCIKFRSMYLDAEKNGAMFSQRKDSRIFPYGSFMRITRIDELPQIINIFKKDISMIGPRPERPIFIETFEKRIPYYRLRHNVEPGITGYAQVMFTYGAGEEDARHKLMYDLYYIKNWSVKLEFYIVFRTIMVILRKSGR